jgi:hypothetical protein
MFALPSTAWEELYMYQGFHQKFILGYGIFNEMSRDIVLTSRKKIVA